MNEITVDFANPDEYEAVGTLVNKLLIELFPDEEEYRQPSKHISAAKMLLERGSNVLDEFVVDTILQNFLNLRQLTNRIFGLPMMIAKVVV